MHEHQRERSLPSTRRLRLARAIAVAVAPFVLCLPAGATDYNDRQTGNWNDQATWNDGASGYPQQAADTATIDSGTVTANIDVPAINSITVTNPGSLNTSLAQTKVNTVTINGGSFNDYGGAVPNWNFNLSNATMTCRNTFNGNLQFSGANLLRCQDSAWLTFNQGGGAFSGTGKITLRGGYVGTTFHMYGDNSNYTGDWETLEGMPPYESNQAYIRLVHTNGVGLNSGGGEVKLTKGGLGVDIYSGWTLPRNITLNGGLLEGVMYSSFVGIFSGNIRLMTNSMIRCNFDHNGCNGPALRFAGRITEDSPGTIVNARFSGGDCPNDGNLWLDNASNSFSGGLTIDGYVPFRGTPMYRGRAHISAPGAQGSGPITLYNYAKLYLNNAAGTNNWTLTNNINGIGTITVEDGSGTWGYTAQGNVMSPGTNTTLDTNSTGILTIDGGFAFGSSGGTYAMLNIDIVDTNNIAGVDYDRLVVNHTVSALGYGDLNVNIPTNMTPEMVAGQQFTILTSGNNLAGQTFHSVSWPVPGTQRGRWRGDVEYGGYDSTNGFARISNLRVIASGTLIVLQ